jgi:hypothetical protein
MHESGIILDYRGQIDFGVIDILLKKLKKNKDYSELNLITRKRAYALFVESLDNIVQHSELKAVKDTGILHHVMIRKDGDKIIITAGNPVKTEECENIVSRIDIINKADDATLLNLYQNKINSKLKDEDKCAGLGFLFIGLKSGNKIKYRFSEINVNYSFFEIEITLNKYIMRKLIIDQKSNSPKVILDPEKKIFLISGESRPPDVREFYGRILEWTEEFGSHLVLGQPENEPVSFDFNFEYFNSSSGKQILDLCKVLANLRTKGANININWHFEKDDSDMLEAGKEFSNIVKFPFEYVEL